MSANPKRINESVEDSQKGKTPAQIALAWILAHLSMIKQRRGDANRLGFAVP